MRFHRRDKGRSMLFTITTTHTPATDLGYLLHKHPARVQTFDLSFGQAHVFYPEADPERCTAALLLDIDPLHLTQNRHTLWPPPSSAWPSPRCLARRSAIVATRGQN